MGFKEVYVTTEGSRGVERRKLKEEPGRRKNDLIRGWELLRY